MKIQTFFRLTDQGFQPVFTGTLEEFEADIAKQSELAKQGAEEHLEKLKAELTEKPEQAIEDMTFEEIEQYRNGYFNKLFAIKNLEHKLSIHSEQTVKDDYFFAMDSVGKKVEF